MTKVLFLGLAIALTARLFTGERFSEWEFGDAQTLMASQHYAEEGFLPLKFLWVPQGWSHLSPRLEEAPVRQHTQGSRQPGLTPHRLYTHYPSWYAVPYGLFAQAGARAPWIYQLWALALSLLGLFFFHRLVSRVGSASFALLTVTAYTLSPGFLGYCDSLATMPYDDGLRFACLALWVASPGSRIVYGLYALACLTSLDSVLFIPIFCLGYAFWERRRLRPALLGFFLAGLAAGLVHGGQTALYLGVTETIQEWASCLQMFGGPGNGRWGALDELARRSLGLGAPGLSAVAALTLTGALFRGHRLVPAFRLAFLLLLAGLAFPLALPGKIAPMPYEVRQLAPAASVLLAIVIWLVTESLTRRLPSARRVLLPLSAGVALLWVGNLLYDDVRWSLARTLDLPARSRVDRNLTDLFRAADARYPGDKVMAQFGSWLPPWRIDGKWVQVHPLVEYESRALLLSFQTAADLARDMRYLWERRRQPVTVLVLYAPEPSALSRLAFAWESEGYLTTFSPPLLSPDQKLAITALQLRPQVVKPSLSRLQ